MIFKLFITLLKVIGEAVYVLNTNCVFNKRARRLELFSFLKAINIMEYIVKFYLKRAHVALAGPRRGRDKNQRPAVGLCVH